VAHLGHPLPHHLDLERRPVQLDQQHGTGVEWQARADGRLGGANRQCVHHLDRRRDDAPAMIADNRLTGVVGRHERSQ